MPTLPTNPQSIGASGHVNDHNKIVTALAAAAYLSSGTVTDAGGTNTYRFGKVLQIVSTTKSDLFSTTSTTYTDVTGLSVSITPIATTSKILVLATLSLMNNTTGYLSRGAIVRGTTIIGGGTPSGNRPAASFVHQPTASGSTAVQTMVHLDSPATTSATTYKIQAATESGSTCFINRSIPLDNDLSQVPRMASSLTVVELGA